MRIPSILVFVALLGFGAALGSGCGLGSEPTASTPSTPTAPTVAPPAGAGNTHDPAPQPGLAFIQAGYRYCDAVLLGAAWSMPADDAKAAGGVKLAAGQKGSLDRDLDAAREAARRDVGRACSFAETGYVFDDAAALARAWQTSTSEAKATIVQKVHWGSYENIDELLASARAAAPAPLDPDEAALRAFFESDRMDACHAKMLAAAWGSTLSQAKVILGHKAVSQSWALYDETMGQARQHAQANPEARCTWIDTSFTYADAEALASAWDLPVQEAKTTLASKYLWGNEQQVRADLRQQRGG